MVMRVNKLTNLEIGCVLSFIIIGILCLISYFFHAYLIIPTIKLNGDKVITLDVNSKYDDLGATAELNGKDISNRIVKKGTISTDTVGKYEIIYSITNDKGYRKKNVKRIINVVDLEKPVIILEGKKKVTVSFGDLYKEFGYTAKDDYDGDLTKNVVINGHVNVKKIGTYTLTYTVVDSSSNKVSEKREITVIDNKAPVIDLDGKSKVVVKLNGEYKESGFTALDNYDGDLTDKVKVSGTINTKKIGLYKLTYSVKDSFGNVATKVRKVQVGTQKDRDKLTYIEVSISNQRLWFYKNGELVISSNVVTGLRNSHDTYKGKFRIYGKTRNTYLVGDDYRSWVDFWMPFNGDQGLHDATWRSSFGGSIYIYSGSHGCVNLPYGTAQTIFEKAPVGTAVIIY